MERCGTVSPRPGGTAKSSRTCASSPTIKISEIYNSINTSIVSINTSIVGQQSTASNKQLSDATANLFWSPVAFVDFGSEFFWGHRVTTANFKGDAYALEALMRVRF